MEQSLLNWKHTAEVGQLSILEDCRGRYKTPAVKVSVTIVQRDGSPLERPSSCRAVFQEGRNQSILCANTKYRSDRPGGRKYGMELKQKTFPYG